MRRLITFIFGLLLLALVTAMLFLASAIYDTGKQTSIKTYFFQTDNVSLMRPGEPVPVSELNETAIRDMLIKKYLTEYFYVIPDRNNIENRMVAGSVLSRMSMPDVFEEWKNGEAETIKKMVERNEMRTANIDGTIYKKPDSDYWVVPYVLSTWKHPNDMSSAPILTRGTLLMNVWYAPGLRETLDHDTFDVGKYLKHSYNRFDNKYDPAIIFRFGVLDLERY